PSGRARRQHLAGANARRHSPAAGHVVAAPGLRQGARGGAAVTGKRAAVAKLSWSESMRAIALSEGRIAGLDPAIHRLRKMFWQRRWMRGSSPRMTGHGLLMPPGGLALVEKCLDAFAPFGRRARFGDAARGQSLERVVDRAARDLGDQP